MQLDRTHVKVRARSLAEIGDLSLLLVRRYFGALAIGFTLGVLPWAILNFLLIGFIPIEETRDGIIDEQTYYERARYVWLMAALVFLQAPIAGMFTTYYIGQAVFEERPPWRMVGRACWQSVVPLLWVLGVVRGPLVAMVILATNWGGVFAPGREVFWLTVIVLWAATIRSLRPFMPEILLLERCPVLARHADRTGGISASRRSGLLHGPISGDLMGRYLMTAAIIGALALAFFYGIMAVRGFLTTQWNWTIQFGSFRFADVQLLWIPLALWIAAGLATFMRFLGYLDARIRLEGWEVELAVRAEALRQFGTEASPILSPPQTEAAR
ncbi:hypothetical protein [Roseimaritima sediminicola]|uniref:hypothetical protein n=1 Tax=Roseimaritima sediminicola TaxID=2662066 RepID=UPI0012984817|nr:hypothetical protein [Roseimaritima sediminicola]